MRKTGGRLDVAGVFSTSQQRHLEPIDNMEYKSHSISKAEREIKALKQENQKLKADLTEIRSMYKQLMTENSHERFDERRVTLLKSQIIQLERQLLLYNEALGSRGDVLLDVENNLQWLADKCRSFICKDVKGPQVPVERSELTLMVETAESARIKLYKQLENNTTQTLSRPLRFYSEFLKESKKDDITLLDVASGNLDHLNLKYVTQLESKLSSLYRDLIHLHATMEDVTHDTSAYLWTSCHVTQVARERLMTQVLKTCAQMKNCTSDLLELSLLYPSAPWPPAKKCALKDITPEKVLQCLPRSRSQEAQRVVQALVKAYNYKVFMLNSKNQGLQEEVKYHQKVYNLQLKYTESLFQAIREAYCGFEKTSSEVVVKPLKDILEAYVELSRSASEVSLKKFVKTFKDHVEQLSDVVETLSPKSFEESEGSKVLSQYGEEFFEALETLVKDQQLKRDRESQKMEDIVAEQEKLDRELREILEEQESKLPQTTMTSSVYEHNDITSSEKVKEDKFVPEFVEKKKKSVEKESSHGESERQYDNSNATIWESQLRADEKSETHIAKVKKLHKKEWVDLIDDSQINTGISNFDVNDETGLEANTSRPEHQLSDAELLAFHSQSMGEMSECFPQESLLTDRSKILSNMAEKPPAKQKSKKKLNYIPNTFVPNRTLQLRRSGSLPRIASPETSDLPLNRLQGQSSDMSNMFTDNVRSRTEREIDKTSAKTSKQFKPRPAFR